MGHRLPEPIDHHLGADPVFVEEGSHLAQINGTVRYLYSFEEIHGDDLVLMLDGYDAWFQPLLQTVVARYSNINTRTIKRLNTNFGNKSAEQIGVHQDIFFGAQKRCWPKSAKDRPCYAVPQSNLPSDSCGPGTDTDVNDELNPYINPQFRLDDGSRRCNAEDVQPSARTGSARCQSWWRSVDF